MDNIKSKFNDGFNSIKESKPKLIGVICLLILFVLVILYRTYKRIAEKEIAEPIIVRNIKAMDSTNPNDLPIFYPSDVLVYPAGGNSYTFSSWLYIRDVGDVSNPINPKYRHIFHCGDKDMNSMSPGVFLKTGTNIIGITFDTVSRTNRPTITTQNNFTSSNFFSGGKFDESNIKSVKDIVSYERQSNISTAGGCSEALANSTYRNGYWIPDENNSGTCYLSERDDVLTSASGFTTFTKKLDSSNSMNPFNSQTDIFMDDKSSIIVENVPLERWFNLVIVLDNVTVEVYVDGKLYKTLVLPGSIKFTSNKTSGVIAGERGGFKGLMNELRYFPYALKYSDVYNIYVRGPTPFYFTKLLGKRIEVFDKYMDEYRKMAKDAAESSLDALDETSVFFFGEADTSGRTISGLQGLQSNR
jgi:hypothetical protein